MLLLLTLTPTQHCLPLEKLLPYLGRHGLTLAKMVELHVAHAVVDAGYTRWVTDGSSSASFGIGRAAVYATEAHLANRNPALATGGGTGNVSGGSDEDLHVAPDELVETVDGRDVFRECEETRQ